MKPEVGKTIEKDSSVLVSVCLQIKNKFQAHIHNPGMLFIHVIIRSSELQTVALRGSAYVVASTEPQEQADS